VGNGWNGLLLECCGKIGHSRMIKPTTHRCGRVKRNIIHLLKKTIWGVIKRDNGHEALQNGWMRIAQTESINTILTQKEASRGRYFKSDCIIHAAQDEIQRIVDMNPRTRDQELELARYGGGTRKRRQ